MNYRAIKGYSYTDILNKLRIESSLQALRPSSLSASMTLETILERLETVKKFHEDNASWRIKKTRSTEVAYK